MTVFRWEKGDRFVEIEECHSVDINAPALIVSSNAFHPHMPVQWREQVPRSDKQACDQLIESVRQWAEEHGFVEVSTVT